MVIETRSMTVEEYLAFESESEFKHEFIDGEIIAMTGGTVNHSAIIAYTIGALISVLENSDCVVHSSEMRVRIDNSKYVYPDVSVVCGDAQATDNATTMLNPTLVVEVTSPSSLAHDHVDKVAYYGAVPSIQGYLILDQQRVFAEWYTRAGDGWHLRQFSDLNDVIPLEPLNCNLTLAAVYRGVTLEA